MNTEFRSIVLAAAALMFAASADAAQYRFDVFAIDGLQETPPVATPATGSATVYFDDVTGQMDVLDGVFQNLIGTSNNAHVHGYAATGAGPAGVVFGLTFDVGVTTGTFSGSGVIPAARIPDVLAGLTYINIHSTFRPGGEIRGQIIDPVLIPEPLSAVMFCAGVLGLVPFSRRSRRRA
jgi:hypothetical protein